MFTKKIEHLQNNMGNIASGGGDGEAKVSFIPAEPEVTLASLKELKKDLQKEFNTIIDDDLKPKINRMSDRFKDQEKLNKEI